MDRGRAACGGLFERPFVSWRNDVALFMGPRLAGYSAVDVEDLTEVDIRSHRLMAAHLAVYRDHAPGFEAAFLMLSAPQTGVRHARRLVGVERVTREDWPSGVARPDEIGVSPSLSPKYPVVSVPYGALVPAELRRVAGRRPGGVVRCHEPLVPARGAAMLDDRPGGRSGGGAGGWRRSKAARGADWTVAGGVGAAGGAGSGEGGGVTDVA